MDFYSKYLPTIQHLRNFFCSKWLTYSTLNYCGRSMVKRHHWTAESLMKYDHSVLVLDRSFLCFHVSVDFSQSLASQGGTHHWTMSARRMYSLPRLILKCTGDLLLQETFPNPPKVCVLVDCDLFWWAPHFNSFLFYACPCNQMNLEFDRSTIRSQGKKLRQFGQLLGFPRVAQPWWLNLPRSSNRRKCC